jgi:hypothetical protein
MALAWLLLMGHLKIDPAPLYFRHLRRQCQAKLFFGAGYSIGETGSPLR